MVGGKMERERGGVSCSSVRAARQQSQYIKNRKHCGAVSVAGSQTNKPWKEREKGEGVSWGSIYSTV